MAKSKQSARKTKSSKGKDHDLNETEMDIEGAIHSCIHMYALIRIHIYVYIYTYVYEYTYIYICICIILMYI
jgi:hypothetical protein